jgi:hypothetical protein
MPRRPSSRLCPGYQDVNAYALAEFDSALAYLSMCP